jgi:DNA-binding transcriptional regulator YdaS (Cro superfamily)
MNAIQQAIDAAGGPSRMAAALGVTAQAVCFWRDGKRRLPFDHGPAIERLAGGVVTRQQLFPNDWRRVWPELVTGGHDGGQDAVVIPSAQAPSPVA